jgi:tRNA-specific 2-thiouridylase
MAGDSRIMVGLSGGVDSSVAALLLQRQGYRVEGLFMKNWEEDDTADYCSATEDLKDAQAVADLLRIPLHTVNFASEYWDQVFAYFLDEYRAGRTPNPDVLCNREIKFRAFLDFAREHLAASHIATGHYASLERTDNVCRMIRAADEEKDQTYFLYMLDQSQLCHALFPLGDLKKQQVREMARQAGFPNHKKKDSTGICFIGERKFRDFLQRYLPAQPGDIENPDGKVIGHHQGLMYYTLGQRQGLGIGGRQDAQEAPWYVVAKDLERNRLIAAQGRDHPLLLCQTLEAAQLHWITGDAPSLPLTCHARIRHRQPLQACEIQAAENGRCRLLFEQPQWAVTPGQAVVFYRHRECLGGGTIEKAIP